MPISNVCLKWVSAEDGSHILTVALGTYVFLYTQVSQGAAQRNIVMMKEHDTHRRGPLRKASSLANPETISTRLVSFALLLCLQDLTKLNVVVECGTVISNLFALSLLVFSSVITLILKFKKLFALEE